MATIFAATENGGLMMDIETAIKKLRAEYERAKNLEFVRNPLAYALFQVWRMVDKKEG